MPELTGELALACVLVVALGVYVLTGGADFGGGVWELLATGPRKRQQRALIAAAIAPIWEANHVWLILAIVVLFAGFPAAFAAISTALHIPIALLLVGIVLRGAAFVFRSYDTGPGQAERSGRWSMVFAIASTLTPVMLGVCAAAVVSGDLRVDRVTGRVQTDFVSSWLGTFPFAVGAMLTVLFAHLAAVYLCVELEGAEQQAEGDARVQKAGLLADFRARALVSGIALGPLAALCIWLSREQAPAIWAGLRDSGWAIGLHLMTAACAVATLLGLWRRNYRAARVLAGGLATGIVLGWALSQFPLIVVPDLSIQAAAAPANVIATILWALAIGAVPLLLAFRYLYAVFK